MVSEEEMLMSLPQSRDQTGSNASGYHPIYAENWSAWGSRKCKLL